VGPPGFVPLLGKPEEIARIVGQDRAASLCCIAELGLIRSSEAPRLTSSLAVNPMLREDCGQDG
jgi:hypothetical protein